MDADAIEVSFDILVLFEKGDWSKWPLEVPFDLNHLVILWFLLLSRDFFFSHLIPLFPLYVNNFRASTI